MKLKKLSALLALVMSLSAVSLPVHAEDTTTESLFGDIDGNGVINATDASWILRYAAATGAGYTRSLEFFIRSDGQMIPEEIMDDGDTLTIVSWNDNDLKNMIAVFNEDYPDVPVQYVNCGASSGDGASTKYQTFLNSGEDIDLFIAESGWILKYINDDLYSAPLSKLDITEADYADAYDYTIEIGTDSNGILKGASWQAAPGGYCYNADLAKEYFGVETPEEMQEKIGDWDKFYTAAEELSVASNYSITIAASLDDMWQCFSTSTNSPWLVDGKINTEPAREFTKMILPYIQNASIDVTVSQWGKDWMTLGKDNGTMGYFFSTWCLTKGNQLEQYCGTEGNWRIVKGPQEYFWGGSWLCLSPTCDNKTYASDFVKYFTADHDGMKKYALQSGDFVNNKVVMEEIVAEGSNSNALLGGQDQFAILKDAAENIKLNETITEYDEDLKLSLRYALHAESIYSAIFDGDVETVVNQFLQEAKAKVPARLFPDDFIEKTEPTDSIF